MKQSNYYKLIIIKVIIKFITQNILKITGIKQNNDLFTDITTMPYSTEFNDKTITEPLQWVMFQ